jgi:hypothetical protein
MGEKKTKTHLVKGSWGWVSSHPKIVKRTFVEWCTGGCWVTQAIAFEPLGIKKPSHNFTKD